MTENALIRQAAEAAKPYRHGRRDFMFPSAVVALGFQYLKSSVFRLHGCDAAGYWDGSDDAVMTLK